MPQRPATERIDPYESLGFHCALTQRAFVAALDQRLKGSGLAPVQFVALAHLTALGPLSQGELADRLSISAPSGSALVDRMERDGWVDRLSDPNDGRVRLVALTDKAVATWGLVSGEVRAMLEEAYQGVHPSELETVKRVLGRVRRNLGA